MTPTYRVGLFMQKDGTYFVPLLLIAICLCFTISNRWMGEDGNAWKQVIEGDGRGYYAYLPAVLLHHDLSFTQVVKREQRLYSKVRRSSIRVLWVSREDYEVWVTTTSNTLGVQLSDASTSWFPPRPRS